MNIKEIHQLCEYNYRANKQLQTASASIPQKQFIKPAALPAEYGSSPGNFDFAVFLNEFKS